MMWGYFIGVSWLMPH